MTTPTIAGIEQYPGIEGAHILSAEQFVVDELPVLFGQADELHGLFVEDRRELALRHVGRHLFNLFYEPSTRTRVSFGKAALNMGMGVEFTEDAKTFSSAAKGETLEDTVKVLGEEYGFDAIVLRYHEEGGAKRAARVSQVPIINAGDGAGEHPTQSLLDAYTIHQQHGRLDNLNVVMGGDLAKGRTVRSLAQLLAKFDGNKITFVSTPELQMSEDVLEVLRQHGVKYDETDEVVDALEGADVVYWTRLQKERHASDVAANDASFILDPDTIIKLPQHAQILHPLPRVDEISELLDSDPRAQYFRQAGNGLYLRMALLDNILAA